MFALDTPHLSNTQIQLEKMHASQRKTYPELDKHIVFLKTLGMIERILIYSCIEHDRYVIVHCDFIL